jgi:hypothetical protein
MDERPLVALLGDSLLMDGVEAGLANKRALGIVRLDTSIADIGERLKSLNPELIVFELDTPRSTAVLSLLREQPGTLLLGLDLACSQVIVLNSNRYPTRTMKELCQLAQTEVSYRARLRKGGAATG